MRFAELQLLKYGRFDGCTFSFPEGSSDLHIIVGPNEAGKSTAMSAVGDLLFGFGHTTTYDFLHDRQLLRVGAVLKKGDTELVCRRKKGRSGTLLDANEGQIDEGELAAFLGGQTRESFHRMFSLDHGRLREGGKAILDAQDDVGQAIFAAGSGLVGISGVLDSLEEEIKQIWTKRAGSQDYHLAHRAFVDAQGRFKAAQIKPAAWDQLRKEVEELDEGIKALRDTRLTKEIDREQIERRRRALTPIALLRKAESDLFEIPDTPDLPADAGKTLEEAAREIEVATAEAGLAEGQVTATNDALKQIIVNPSILERRAEIESLREEKGAIDKSLRDLPRRHVELNACEVRLNELQNEIGWPEEAAPVARERLPRQVDIAELRDLLEKRTALDAVLNSAIVEQDTCDEEAREARQELDQLDAPKDAASLISALQAANSHGDLDATIASAARSLKRRQQELDVAITQLSPWTGNAEILETIILPTDVEGSEVASTLAKAEEEAAMERRGLRNESDRRAALELRRRQMLVDDGVVSPQALQEARESRDAAWGAIRGAIETGKKLADETSTLQDFVNRVKIADDLADHRYSAAEQSGRLAALIEELERVQLLISHHEARITTADNKVGEIEVGWSQRLSPSGLNITSKAFLGWSEKRSRALKALGELREVEGQLEEQSRIRRNMEALLVGALGTVDSGFDSSVAHSYSYLIQEAQRLKTAIELAEKKRIKAGTAFGSKASAADRANRRKTTAEANIGEWKKLWEPAVVASGLSPQVSIPVVRAQVDLLEQTRLKIEEIIGLEHRIAAMGSDIDAFGQQVSAIALSSGFTADGTEPAKVLDVLTSELADASTLSERRAGLEAQLADAIARELKASQAKALAEARLAPLIELTGVANHSLLAPIVARAAQVRLTKEKIAGLTEELVRLGDGMSLAAILADSEGADAASLKLASDQMQEECRSLSDDIESQASKRTARKIALEALDDGPAAATAAADMEIARAEMAMHSERYVRKRAEATLLAWTIERYRSQKQNPLLKRASELFGLLTLGRYKELLVDTESNDNRLSGVLVDDAVVPVGGMSEGTRDQLFLSLRIAAVEDIVAGGVRLPFLADDLFINFDDARAAAGFKVLAELAKTTQVLFFTHHQHLLPIARRAVAPQVISECAIP